MQVVLAALVVVLLAAFVRAGWLARRARAEAHRLSGAYDEATTSLRQHIGELEDSRDVLRGSLTRLGETLTSAHDLRRMLAVILETAMMTLRAEAGALMLLTSGRQSLYIKVGRDLGDRVPDPNVRIPVGSGIAGMVAAIGDSIGGAVGQGELILDDNEPHARNVIAVPLMAQGRVLGVINLYDRADGRQFDHDDLATLRSFANQARVAMDNVLLHKEAQRLAVTDGLTGLANYRYFQRQLEREIERASRFGNPLALLVLDLDHFKSVNDRFGHQRGDAVLVELADRIRDAIRDVDLVARYGGEEFVLVLPETDLEGARQTALKVCDVVRARRFGAPGEEPVRLSVSIGAAVYPEHGRTAQTLVKAADAALYAAKEGGRDGFWLAVPQPVLRAVDDDPATRGSA